MTDGLPLFSYQPPPQQNPVMEASMSEAVGAPVAETGCTSEHASGDESRRLPSRDLEQPAQLKRVTSRIGAAIVEFCRARVGQEFFADELRAHVQAVSPSAPASADRILRQLRLTGQVSYVVASRAESRYFVRAVAP